MCSISSNNNGNYFWSFSSKCSQVLIRFNFFDLLSLFYLKKKKKNSRYLLNFGDVSYYLGYHSMTDYFPTMILKPNPSCASDLCKKRQKENEVNISSLILLFFFQNIFFLSFRTRMIFSKRNLFLKFKMKLYMKKILVFFFMKIFQYIDKIIN